MTDTFDPYREALVLETVTVWPEEYDDWELDQRRQVEQLLHESPADAADMEYVRTHTGFCRKITVTAADVERLS